MYRILDILTTGSDVIEQSRFNVRRDEIAGFGVILREKLGLIAPTAPFGASVGFTVGKC